MQDSLSVLKAEARKAAFARRREAHVAAATRTPAACVRLEGEILRPGGTPCVAGYMPIRTEIDPRPAMIALHQAGLPICLPVVVGDGQPLRFRRWTPECVMEAGAFGAAIPADPAEVLPQVLIVPLAAFDRQGGRLGYGGGFYDRTLEVLRARGPVRAIGFAYAAQEAECLPAEPTDQPLDALVTETALLRF